MQLTAVAISAKPVNMMTSMSGCVSFTRRSTSTPSILGIMMSRITTIEGRFIDLLQGLDAVAGGLQRIPAAFQDADRAVDDNGLVVDDQYAGAS